VTWVEGAQIASSVFAGCGLFVTAYQASRGRAVADLQALQKFFDGVQEREGELHDAGDDPRQQRRAFNELLAFLEVHASAHNKHLFGAGSEEMVRHKLEDSVIELEAAKDWHSLIEDAQDRCTTFAELLRFIAHHKPEIERRKAERTRREMGTST
jgi:hypothetical protein